ncbi:hypothetical protein SAMN05444266_104212 [Chitinophaga jiangningensis]|uniref:Uncharacterized protein n=1 Tax=Chitinophaga jiangningensis TaxID=1419482 RepID=A0A1M7C673_9BACT|nr:hypothetical protein SAMN05444266_104212 [Chitinophaga jiangningensis]
MAHTFHDTGTGFPRMVKCMIDSFSQGDRHSTVVVVTMWTINRDGYCTFHNTNLAGGCDNLVSAAFTSP